MIIDAHMHIWNRLHGAIRGKTPLRAVKNGVIKIGKQAMLGMPASLLDCNARAEFVLAEFDAAGVETGVVVQENMDGEQNDYCLAIAKKYKGRFFMHGLPDYFKPARVAKEAAGLFKRGFRGLKLPAGHLLGKLALDDDRFMPIWAQMEAEGHVLAVDLSEGEDQVGMMENILARHPNLKVAVGHFGMVNRRGWPGQLMLCRHRNVYMETGGIIWLYRHEGYPFPDAVDAILRARDEVGIEKLMWGSDWPRTMVDFTYRQSLDFIRSRDIGLKESEKAMLLGENAARLYGLAKPRSARKPVDLITAG
ncbi:MAG: amidohydrolase [Planctomycetes bacterium]|nr:amidohydrolase [Planctomycetota bacterium]